jgi:uncharacterized protein YkwD
MRLFSLLKPCATARPGLARLAAPWAVSILLAACGGGGGDPATAVASGSVTPPAGQGATCGLANFSADLLARVNAVRAAGRSCGTHGNFGPAPALVWNDLLTQAATAHSLDMAAQNYFSHTSLDGRSFDQRISATGYAWQRAAENIAAGQNGVQQVVDGWLASDGHCANIMEGALRDIGVACVSATATTYPTYWTMDLGTPR